MNYIWSIWRHRCLEMQQHAWMIKTMMCPRPGEYQNWSIKVPQTRTWTSMMKKYSRATRSLPKLSSKSLTIFQNDWWNWLVKTSNDLWKPVSHSATIIGYEIGDKEELCINWVKCMKYVQAYTVCRVSLFTFYSILCYFVAFCLLFLMLSFPHWEIFLKSGVARQPNC